MISNPGPRRAPGGGGGGPGAGALGPGHGKKKAGAPPCISYFCVLFRQAEYRHFFPETICIKGKMAGVAPWCMLTDTKRSKAFGGRPVTRRRRSQSGRPRKAVRRFLNEL